MVEDLGRRVYAVGLNGAKALVDAGQEKVVLCIGAVVHGVRAGVAAASSLLLPRLRAPRAGVHRRVEHRAAHLGLARRLFPGAFPGTRNQDIVVVIQPAVVGARV